jgi:hypothetical protein
MTCCSRRLQNMDPDNLLNAPAPPPSNREAGASSPAPMLAAGTVVHFPSPVVLRVLPLRGSPAPVGYIYDATPDADGGLLAAASAFSPTMAIRSFTTPVRISRPIAGPGVWFRPSSLSIACRIISFLWVWSFWRVSLLPRPPTRGRRFWQRTSHLPLRQPLCLICLMDSGLLRRRPFPL